MGKGSSGGSFSVDFYKYIVFIGLLGFFFSGQGRERIFGIGIALLETVRGRSMPARA